MKRILIALSCTAIIFASIMVYVLFTTSGLRLLYSFSPGNLSAIINRGNLFHGFVLEDLHYRGNGIYLQVEQLEVDWKFFSLLRRDLLVNRIIANDIVLERNAGSSSAAAAELDIALPIDLRVDDLVFNNIKVITQDEEVPLVIQKLTARAHTEGQRALIDNLSIIMDNYGLMLKGHVDINNIPAYQLTVDWTCNYSDIGEIAGQTSLMGDNNQVKTSTRISTPAEVEITMDAHDLLSNPGWNATIIARRFNMGILTDTVAEHEVSMEINGSGTLNSTTLEGNMNSLGFAPGSNPININTDAAYEIDDIDLNFNIDASFPSIDNATLSASLEWQQGRIAAVDTTEFNLLLDTGELQVDYSDNAYRLTTRTGFILNDDIDGTLEASGRGDSNTLMLDTFILSLVQGVLTGEFSISKNDDIIVISSDANWNNLLIPINSELSVYLTQGNLRLAGELDDFNLSLDTVIGSNNSGPFQLSILATGDQDSIQVNPLTLRLDGGVVNGSATVLWTDRLTANLELAGVNVDPEKIFAGWPGDLDFNTILSASKFEDDYEVNIDSLAVTGQLREYPLALQLQSVIKNDNIEVNNASLYSGTSSIQIDGVWGADNDITWTIYAPDLSNLHKEMQGQLDATGHLTGSLDQPRLSGNIHSSDLRSPWLDVETIQSSFIINQSGANELDVQLELANLVREDTIVDGLSLTASGTLNQHRYNLQLASSLADLNLSGQGGYSEMTWRGRPEALVIQKDDEDWVVGEPFIVEVGNSKVSVGHFCLDNKVTTVCIAGNWNKTKDWDAMLMVSDLPFDLFNNYLPEGITTSGLASIEFNANQTGAESLKANAEILSNSGGINFEIDEDISQEFALNSLIGKIILVDEALTGQLTIQSANSLSPPLQASISLSPFILPSADYASMDIDGQFNWMVDDLSFASNILPQVADVSGKLAVDLSVDGKLVEPNLSGSLLLENASMMLPKYGIELLDINVKGQPALEDTFQFTGQARSGEGQVTFNAAIISEDTIQQVITAAIQGEKIELINTPEVRAYANTDLVIELSRAKTNLSGNIEVHDALIDLNEIRETVTLSDDVVLVERPSTEKQEIRSDIRLDIDLKDNIQIKGQGIVGQLTGRIVIFSTENGELLGNGEISIIDGKYSAYGQSLDIEEGKFIYSNQQLENPELRIRAVRHIDDITAGLTVTGFLSDPQVTLISSPVLRDEEILSYIVFGRPLDTLTSGEGTNLIGAATALGLNNSGFITRSLSSSFGLDQLELSSDSDGQNASLTVGKYITPKIYISYVIGLMEYLSTAKIRYNLNNKWSLEAKSSAESMGVDVYYSIEK